LNESWTSMTNSALAPDCGCSNAMTLAYRDAPAAARPGIDGLRTF
jgi:hypothetical protein